MNIDLTLLVFIVLWIMAIEYLILDFRYFCKEQELKKWTHKILDEFAFELIEGGVNVEKRIYCPVCNYPMRVLTETDDHYECYCAHCQMDRTVARKKGKFWVQK